MLSYLGSIGIGSISGWLLGKISLQKQQRWFSQLAYFLFALLVLVEVKLFFAWPQVIACGVAGLISLLLHHLWLKKLNAKLDQ